MEDFPIEEDIEERIDISSSQNPVVESDRKHRSTMSSRFMQSSVKFKMQHTSSIQEEIEIESDRRLHMLTSKQLQDPISEEAVPIEEDIEMIEGSVTDLQL